MTGFQPGQQVTYIDTDCGETVERKVIVVKVAEALTTGTVPVLIRLPMTGRQIYVPITRLLPRDGGVS